MQKIKNVTKVSTVLMLTMLCLYSGISAQDYKFVTEPEVDQSNNIRNYLMSEAGKITHESLGGIHSLDDWNSERATRYNQLTESLGLLNVPLKGERPDLNVKITGLVKMDGYRIEKLYYESLKDLFVTANLYIPENVNGQMPAILYLCGHSSGQKVAYQGYARKLAQLGFVVLIVETTHQGEVCGEHHGCYARGWFHWYSMGYTPAGVEVWNAIRGLDLLCSRPEVDPERLGVTGRSGGGAQTWFVAAVDERVKAAVPEVGATTLKEQILTRTIDGHCDCMMPINTQHRDFPEIGALIAPRSLLIQQGNRDRLNNIEGARKMYTDIKKIYGYYQQPDNVKFLEYPGGHGSVSWSRQYMMNFFMEKLMGKTMPLEEIGDADFSEEANLPAEKLKVYIDGPPKNDRTTTIHDSFFKLADAPEIESEKDLASHADFVLDYLKKNTFAAFPETPGSLNPHHIFRSTDMDEYGSDIYSFVPEEGWRLRIDIRWKHDPGKKKPLLIVLRKQGDGYFTASDFADELGDQWNIAYVNLRGIDQAGWEPGLQWHIRRAAAWTGRTIASMQVYDLLRTLEFCRTLDGVDPDHISIAGRDELGVVTLYAALLDGNIEELILRNPPPSQNSSSSPDGKGVAIEMLNCLRITDVWHLPALIPDTKMTFVNEIPEAFLWSEGIRKKLNKSEFTVIKL